MPSWRRTRALQPLRFLSADAATPEGTARILRKTLASLDGAVFVVTGSGHRRVTQCNAAAKRIFGYSRDDLLGSDTRLLHVDDAHYQTFARRVADALKETGTYRSRFQMRRRDGSTFPTRHVVSLLEPEKGMDSDVVSIVYDITEEEDARRRLQVSEERFRQIAESVSDVFWIQAVGDEDRLEYVSPAYREVWGRDPNEVSEDPHRWREALHPDDRERVVEGLPRQLEGPWEDEFRILRPDGEVRWIWDRSFPVRDDEGRVYRIVGVARDVTERRELQERLRQSQKMEAVGRLAAGVAHDFNNLLTVIQGHVELVMDELEVDSDLRSDLEEVQRAARQGSGLVRQLLAFGRRQVVEEVVLDLGEAVDEMESMLRRLIPKRVGLVFQASDVPQQVRMDPSQIHQTVMNLVTNAAEAIEGAGTVTLRVDRQTVSASEARVVPWEVSPGRYARLTVEDDGKGMDDSVKAQVFEPFFTTRSEEGGTGLGLSMVYGIVKQSGGHIFVESEPGRGTAFRVLLPLAADDEDR